MRKNNFQQKELEGINIYLDKKGQKVYLDPITKNGYVITPEKEKQFKTYSNVVLYAALSGVFAYALFDWHPLICVVIALAVFGVLEWRFRLFLNKCSMYSAFKPEKKHQPTAYSSPDSIIYVKIVLYIAMAGLLIATCILGENTNVSIYVASICLAITCVYVCIRYIMIIVARKSHHD